MGFPNLESALKILRHHRVHEMLDGVFFADEAQEKEPRAKSNQNYQGYAAYRVAESLAACPRLWPRVLLRTCQGRGADLRGSVCHRLAFGRNICPEFACRKI